MLLGRDWIHANGCVPSTLHQCVGQWVGDRVEVVRADDSASVALAELYGELRYGEVKCLSGRDFSDCDFVSVGRDSFVPLNVKPTSISRLNDTDC